MLLMTNEINGSLFRIYRGDITEQECDAIVNAANARLAGGGGVDGAIHQAAGPTIMEQCRQIGGCPVGQAVVTSAGELKAKYIIHTVGPMWTGGFENEPELLRSAYEQSLRHAVEHNAESIAFPCISTGAYGFPKDKAAHIAFQTIVDFLNQSEAVKEVRVVVFSTSDFKDYEAADKEIISKPYFGCWWNFYQTPVNSYRPLFNLFTEDSMKEMKSELEEIAKQDSWEEDSIRLLNDRNW